MTLLNDIQIKADAVAILNSLSKSRYNVDLILKRFKISIFSTGNHAYQIKPVIKHTPTGVFNCQRLLTSKLRHYECKMSLRVNH